MLKKKRSKITYNQWIEEMQRLDGERVSAYVTVREMASTIGVNAATLLRSIKKHGFTPQKIRVAGNSQLSSALTQKEALAYIKARYKDGFYDGDKFKKAQNKGG